MDIFKSIPKKGIEDFHSLVLEWCYINFFQQSFFQEDVFEFNHKLLWSVFFFYYFLEVSIDILQDYSFSFGRIFVVIIYFLCRIQ